VSSSRRSRSLTDQEIARRCPHCRYAKFIAGAFVCQLRTCKYLVQRRRRQPRTK